MLFYTIAEVGNYFENRIYPIVLLLMKKMGNLDAMLMGSFELCFIVTKVCNLYANLGGYFKLSFIMTDVGNIYTNLGLILNYLVIAEVGNLYAKLGLLYFFYNGIGVTFLYKLQ
jgi:hypothetical protein